MWREETCRGREREDLSPSQLGIVEIGEFFRRVVYLFQVLACVGFLRLPLLGDLGRRDGDRRLPQGLQIDLEKSKDRLTLFIYFLYMHKRLQTNFRSIVRNKMCSRIIVCCIYMNEKLTPIPLHYQDYSIYEFEIPFMNSSKFNYTFPFSILYIYV